MKTKVQQQNSEKQALALTSVSDVPGLASLLAAVLPATPPVEVPTLPLNPSSTMQNRIEMRFGNPERVYPPFRSFNEDQSTMAWEEAGFGATLGERCAGACFLAGSGAVRNASGGGASQAASPVFKRAKRRSAILAPLPRT